MCTSLEVGPYNSLPTVFIRFFSKIKALSENKYHKPPILEW